VTVPYLLDLADACRASGLTVVEEPGWTGRGHGPMSTGAPEAIICHHTAGPATGESPSLGVVINGRADLPGPLAQLFLSRSGVVHVVAAGLAYHAGAVFETYQSNAYAIGIEAEATGVDPWPAGQYDAYRRLCAALCAHYGLPVARVLGHKEVAAPLGRKIDPNFDMTAFRVAVEEADMSLTVDEHNMLVAIHTETTRRLPNRRGPLGVEIVGGGDDTLLGYATNADGFGFRVEPTLAAVKADVTAVKADVAAVKAAVASIEVGGVDLDLLAGKVADLLAARLAA
jgi:hypothetical protein